MSKFCVEAILLIFLLSQVHFLSSSDVMDMKTRKIIKYDYFYRSEMKIDVEMEMPTPLPKLILIILDGLTLDHLKNYSLPNIEKYFFHEGVVLKDESAKENPSNKSNVSTKIDHGEHNLNVPPIWILNQLKRNARSAIIGGFPGANSTHWNHRVAYFKDKNNKLNWVQKTNALMSLLTDKHEPINMGLLYLPELRIFEQKHGRGDRSIGFIMHRFDSLLRNITERLEYIQMEDEVNILITSSCGLDKQVKNSTTIINKLKQEENVEDVNVNKTKVDVDVKVKEQKKRFGKPSIGLKKKKSIESSDTNAFQFGHNILLARGPLFKHGLQVNSTLNGSQLYELTRFIFNFKCNLCNETTIRYNLSAILKKDEASTQTLQNTSYVSNRFNGSLESEASAQRANSSDTKQQRDMKKSLSIEFENFYKIFQRHYRDLKLMNFLHLLILFIILITFIITVHIYSRKIVPDTQSPYILYRPLTPASSSTINKD